MQQKPSERPSEWLFPQQRRIFAGNFQVDRTRIYSKKALSFLFARTIGIGIDVPVDRTIRSKKINDVTTIVVLRRNIYFYIIRLLLNEMKIYRTVIAVILVFIYPDCGYVNAQCCPEPEQVHISLGNADNEFFVTWLTFCQTNKSVVWYGIAREGFTSQTEGCCVTFVDSGQGKIVRYIHKVALKNLKPDSYYIYRVGSTCGASRTFLFKTFPCGRSWSPRVILFGDMGLSCSYTLPYIYKEVNMGCVDAIVHLGDIGYNLDSYNGFIGDDFLKLVEPVASRVPYMVAPGDRDHAYNFSHYRYRFTMPGNGENLYYSFNMGPAHFVVISTEVYYFTQFGYEPLFNQLKWLERDLRMAAHPIYRRVRPWIIVLGHRPMYCSSDYGEDCSLTNAVTRLRFCPFGLCDLGLENLFHRYAVDVAFWGHMHYYSRTWPIFDGQIYNGSYCRPYINPKAAIHVITGAAGNRWGTERLSSIRADRFPFFSSHYTYTRLLVLNQTILQVEQVSASSMGSVIDTFCVVKDICL